MNPTQTRPNPFERLGKRLPPNTTWADLEEAGNPITFPVEKVPMSDLILAYTSQPDEFGTVRSDGHVLRTGMGKQHTVFPACEGYEFGKLVAEQVIGTVEAALASVTLLRGGRQWFVTFDTGEFTVGDYNVAGGLTACGSYDSSIVMNLFDSSLIIACSNAIASAKMHGGVRYSFKHTSGIFDRVEEAKRAVRAQVAEREAYVMLAEKLMGVRVSDADYRSIVDKLFPVGDDVSVKVRNANDNARTSVRALWTAQADGIDVVQGVEGSAWALLQSVNTYENWGAPVRKVTGLGTESTRALRQIDAMVSGKQPLTDKVLELVAA